MLNIVENKPLSFELWGLYAGVPDQQYAAVGLRLMDEMWRQLKLNNIRSAKTNHWVYIDVRIFVGVELLNGESAPAGFEQLKFRLDRYLQHLHVGEYEALPTVWRALMSELRYRGESIAGPSLEVYDHQSCDSNEPPKTVILIPLQPK